MNPVVVFFHIPKAAGTSIREQIAFQLKANRSLYISDISEIAYLSDQSLNSYDFISGHVGIQLLNRIERPAIKLIFLRDPVARVRSQYQYLKKLAAMDVPFNGYTSLLRGRSLKELLNDKNDPQINSWFRDTQTWTLIRDYQHHYRYLEMAHSEVLDIAKENLEKMDCFGIVEFMDESFDLLNAKFGWSMKNNAKENVSVYDEELADKHDTDLVIKEHNSLDVKLYEWACERFKQQADGKAECSLTTSGDAKQKVFCAEINIDASKSTIMESANYHTLPKALLIERIQHSEKAKIQAEQLANSNRTWAERTEQMLAAARQVADDNRAWAERTEQMLAAEKEISEKLRTRVDNLNSELTPLRVFAKRFSWLYKIFQILRWEKND